MCVPMGRSTGFVSGTDRGVRTNVDTMFRNGRRTWSLLASYFIASIGAIIGGGIGTYLALFCWILFLPCSAVLGVIGGVVGGLIGGAIHHLLFRRGMHPSGCLGFLGLGFLGLVVSLIVWVVLFIN